MRISGAGISGALVSPPAPVILAEAGVLRGLRATCNPWGTPLGAYIRRLEEGGAEWGNQPVVVPFATPATLFSDVFLATGPGGALPISGWDGDGFTEGALGYEIVLTGAEVAPAVVPEPTSLIVWSGGSLGVWVLCRARGRRTGMNSVEPEKHSLR